MDTTQAFGVLVLLMVAGYGGRRIFGFLTDERLARDWAELLPIINGEFQREGLQRWLVGHYRDRQVRVRADVPDKGDNLHRFTIEFASLPGGKNWTIKYQTAFVVFGFGKWSVESKNAAIQEKLAEVGLLDFIERFATPAATIEYSQEKQTLIYSDLLKKPMPSRDRFVASLDLVVQLAEINEQVNPSALN